MTDNKDNLQNEFEDEIEITEENVSQEEVVISKEEYENLKKIEEMKKAEGFINAGNIYAKVSVPVRILDWVIGIGCLTIIVAIIYGVLTR
ncbi:MAG: hypothetical protein R3Y32_00775 [Bacillota bacterium]